jgi:hypothetical protein
MKGNKDFMIKIKMLMVIFMKMKATMRKIMMIRKKE